MRKVVFVITNGLFRSKNGTLKKVDSNLIRWRTNFATQKKR